MATSVLRQRDFERLLDVVGAVQGSDDLDELRRRTVDLLPTLVPNDRTAWTEFDPATGAVEQVTVPPVELPDAETIFAETSVSHPVMQHTIRTGDGRPAAISDFLSATDFHETSIYQRFYGPLGAEDQLSTTLPKPDVLVALALNRDRRGFSQRSRELLNRLRPHLVLSYGKVVVINRLRAALAAAEAAMEQHGEGVVLLDGRGAPDYVSAGAADLLDRWLPSERDEQLRVLSSWAADRDAEPLVLHDRDVRLVAHRLASVGHDAILLREAGRDPEPEDLLRRSGLSPREAQVVALAVRGAENRVIAAELFIGVRTVESHMRRALDKLGVANRTEAGDLVRRLLADS